MFPVILNIGPLSTAGFLIFGASVFLLWFAITAIFKPSKSLRNDLLLYAVFLVAAALVLKLTGKALPLRTYGLTIATGFILATLFATSEAKRAGISQNLVMDVAIIALIAGIAGARLFYVIFYGWDYYMHNPAKIFAVWEGGLVIYGSLIVGGISLFLYLRKKQVNLKALMDIVSMGVLIGLAFGRIGCLGFGCCYGQPHGPAGILGWVFPAHSPAWDEQVGLHLIPPDAACSLPVWPTQVISSLAAAGLFLFLFLVHRKFKKFDGEIVSLFFVFYGVGRFLIEFMRTNPHYGPFSSAQWISLGMVILGTVFLVRFGRRSVPRA